MVYRLEGSVNKLMLDDKGSTLVCIWGLCPLAHSDDPSRAIFTAINMRKELAKIDNTWVNIGISTGDVFTGVVGSSGSRKEFTVLGDAVNLAARIMMFPKKKNKVGCINACMRTRNESMHQVSFNYQGHQEFKGKSISMPIFEVIEPKSELIKPRVP
jgi:class 3 adenylate cyclase